MRTVVVLFGPPGAGKTTTARASGLVVLDRDDPQWSGEAQFAAALDSLGAASRARAVVIRSGATSTARRRVVEQVRATHWFLVLAPREELARRVRARRREDLVRTLAGIDRWFRRFDRDDDVPDFPGWAAALAPPALGVTSTDW